MEARQSQRIPNKTLSAGRSGAAIAGLLVFGGALAVAGVIAIASFVTNRNKSKPSPHRPQQSESDHPSQGIPSLQDSSPNHDNACYETSNTTKDQVVSSESLASQTSILEDTPDLNVETYVEEEIMLSDDSPPESTVSFNDNGTGEEDQESSADSPSSEEIDQSEPQEPLKSIEIIPGQDDNDGAIAKHEIVEVSEDDIAEEDDHVGFETSDNSSEATERTCLDSKQVKGEMVNGESEEAEGTAESNTFGRDDKSVGGANASEFSGPSSEKPNLYEAVNNHVSVSKFKTWAMLLLLFAILLLIANGTSGYLTVAIL